MKDKKYEVLVIGAGPCGLAAAIDAQKAGFDYLILEKGSIVNSIRRYPVNMTFFSTADNIAIGGIPLPTVGPKANRQEALEYYSKVLAYYNLNIQLYNEVYNIARNDTSFVISSEKGSYFAKYVILATGYFDMPRKLNIPGEGLPHVSHYFDEPYRYTQTRTVIVGAGNSAVETALDLYRHNVEVTMVIRKKELKETAKYWLKPDLENRIKEGAIKVMFDTSVERIESDVIIVRKNGREVSIPADFVLLLTGYLPNLDLMVNAGVQINPKHLGATYDPVTHETNVEGLYVAGTVLCGSRTESVFIENGRYHGKAIVQDILRKNRNKCES